MRQRRAGGRKTGGRRLGGASPQLRAVVDESQRYRGAARACVRACVPRTPTSARTRHVHDVNGVCTDVTADLDPALLSTTPTPLTTFRSFAPRPGSQAPPSRLIGPSNAHPRGVRTRRSVLFRRVSCRTLSCNYVIGRTQRFPFPSRTLTSSLIFSPIFSTFFFYFYFFFLSLPIFVSARTYELPSEVSASDSITHRRIYFNELAGSSKTVRRIEIRFIFHFYFYSKPSS